jgi:hypothetical protein
MFTISRGSNAGAFSQQNQSALSFSMSTDGFLFGIAADGEMPIHVVSGTLENFRI